VRGLLYLIFSCLARLAQRSRSNDLTAQRKPSATIFTPQPPNIQNEQNDVSVVTEGDEQPLITGGFTDRRPSVMLINNDPRCQHTGVQGGLACILMDI